MPWKIQKDKSGYLVINKDTGAVKSRFPTLARAQSYLKALYANYKEK